ncbi:hypothetical protein B2G71_00740 [Novosphingobium sp. PC22D]|uniref:hypothetical protein n=1 Tax=Novosphingobium sp. PC22D TaxID=1962403 RepID=UPI000BEFDBEF|nr:hypothetical protein [Novosphingobium sp. PC22D]PEQ14173.1 hypothetical protein B2G71_00740 [Novosphingobium sp. PC22D]
MTRRLRLVASAAVAGLALSACTASRYQISDALQRYGLSPVKADCAAEFLRGKLSVRQVDRLTDAARYYNASSRLTFGDLIRVAGSVRDPEIALQVGASALACSIAADIPVPGL